MGCPARRVDRPGGCAGGAHPVPAVLDGCGYPTGRHTEARWPRSGDVRGPRAQDAAGRLDGEGHMPAGLGQRIAWERNALPADVEQPRLDFRTPEGVAFTKASVD